MSPLILDNPVVEPRTLSHYLKELPYDFLQPSNVLLEAAIAQVKDSIDPLASITSRIQEIRRRVERQRRTRSNPRRGPEYKPLTVKQLDPQDGDINQIWEQASKILEASCDESKLFLRTSGQQHVLRQKLEQSAKNDPKHKSAVVRFKDVESEDSDLSNEDDAEMDDIHSQDEEGLEDSGHPDDDDSEYDSAAVGQEDFSDDIDVSDEAEQAAEPIEVLVEDSFGLNDGFFSIDKFNRQSEFMEMQDQRGENENEDSEEEEIDWASNPMTNGEKQEKLINADAQADSEDDDDDDDGPTFGNVDLNGPDDSASDENLDEDIEMDYTENGQNTNDVQYADFFEPPAKKLKAKDGRRALPKTQPLDAGAIDRPSADEMQRTIAAVRRDIFDDELTADEEDDTKQDQASDRRSSHQKRQAKLTEEIRRLEVAAVAKRDWTLSGEARANDRPINSLLEEDLDFERAGKPIPVITQEVSEDIEALIKRRIIARQFDEVIRRRPGNLATGTGKDASVRRGRYELDDNKAQQSLAEIYEAEHQKTANPDTYVGKQDEKLKEEHAKIEALWHEVSNKLDSLANLHYRPKPPQAAVKVIADVPTIAMEEARPEIGGNGAGASMLAPQEIYKPGEGRDKKIEVATRSGLPVAREEMTREEKLRRRRREKERIRKAGGLVGKADAQKKVNNGRPVSKKVEERNGIIGDLKKGGVKVIGKKGELRDVEGNAMKAGGSSSQGAGQYKL